MTAMTTLDVHTVDDHAVDGNVEDSLYAQFFRTTVLRAVSH